MKFSSISFIIDKIVSLRCYDYIGRALCLPEGANREKEEFQGEPQGPALRTGETGGDKGGSGDG